MKYVVCQYCGAHLDHGESCDCKKEAPQATKPSGAKQKTSFYYVITGGEGNQLQIGGN